MTDPRDPRLTALTQMLGRRRFLGLAGLGAGAAALAACGTSGTGGGGNPSSSGDASGGASPSQSFPADQSSDKTLTWANWTLYLDFDSNTKTYPTLADFEKTSGIKVAYKEDIDDNNTFFGKVQGQLKAGQNIGYDIVTLTDWMVARWIRLGYAQPFDAAKIPNKKNILPALAEVPFDKGRNVSLTWQSGMTGLVWNKEKVPGGLKEVADLWRPELKGKVTVLSEMRDTMGVLMLSQGVDLANGFTSEQFGNALNLLDSKLGDGSIYKVQGNSYKEDLLSGKALAGIVWSGDIFQLNAENNDQWGFALPTSKGMLWSDNMFMPSTANHQSNAAELMNYYYDPAVAAKVAAYVNYICPVQGAQAEMEKIDPQLAKSEFIFPSAEKLAQTVAFPLLSPEDETSYNQQWLQTIGV